MSTSTIETHQVTSSDGTTIGYHELGSGPALVMIHGSLSDGQPYLGLAELLAEHFTCYVVDGRGRGLSGGFGDNFTVDTVVADIQAVLAAAGPGAILFGHSYGASMVLQAALRSDDLAGLVLYEPPLPLRAPVAGTNLPPFVAAIDAGDADAALDGAWTTIIGGSVEEREFIKTTPLWGMLTGFAPTWIPELTVLDALPDTVQPYAALDLSVLLIMGSQSPEHLRYSTNAVSEVVPQPSLVDIEGVNHFAHLTNPAALAGPILSWQH